MREFKCIASSASYCSSVYFFNSSIRLDERNAGDSKNSKFGRRRLAISLHWSRVGSEDKLLNQRLPGLFDKKFRAFSKTASTLELIEKRENFVLSITCQSCHSGDFSLKV